MAGVSADEVLIRQRIREAVAIALIETEADRFDLKRMLIGVVSFFEVGCDHAVPCSCGARFAREALGYIKHVLRDSDEMEARRRS